MSPISREEFENGYLWGATDFFGGSVESWREFVEFLQSHPNEGYNHKELARRVGISREDIRTIRTRIYLYGYGISTREIHSRKGRLGIFYLYDPIEHERMKQLNKTHDPIDVGKNGLIMRTSSILVGLPKSAATVYRALWKERRPLHVKNISEITGIPESTVRQGLPRLKEKRLIVSVGKSGRACLFEVCRK